MKLLVIVLCLLSERYLIHAISYTRFHWFPTYFLGISQRITMNMAYKPVLILSLVVLLPWILFFLVWYYLAHLLYGLVGFLLHIIIFYYCLGPNNPFYLVREQGEEEDDKTVGNYLVKVNGELFAVIFWYIVAGPFSVLLYRLISLCGEQPLTAKLAHSITDTLDWIPARITTLLYLLVGNFQKSISLFLERFFTKPNENQILLSQAGLLAVGTGEKNAIRIPDAEHLVEHALIVYLVLLALFTLVSWL